MAPSLSLPPEDVFQFAQAAETELRQQYLNIDSSRPLEADGERHRDLLERSAAFLELMAGAACLLDVARERDSSVSDHSSIDPRSFYRVRVRQLCGLDLDEVIPRSIRVLSIPAPPTGATIPSQDAMLRATRSLLEACPIQHLEVLGAATGLEATAHRCRMAYDALQAYVLRNDPDTNIRIRLVGKSYASGVLTAPEVATLLKVSIPDALALLEAHGHQRPLDAIALTDDDRTSRLGAIRADRIQRAGQVSFSRDLLIRDVIASERIENVDARKWIPKDVM